MMDGMTVAAKEPEYWEDAEGRMVPIGNIKPEHMLEDELVKQVAFRAGKLSLELAKFRADAFAEIAALVDTLASNYDAPRGGAKGNLTLLSFDGRTRVQVAIGDTLNFGPELQIAKKLIDQCLSRWSEGANKNLSVVVLDAFKVGKEGKIDVDRVLGLQRLAIDDPDWKMAMKAIADAVRVTRSKQYLRVYRRERHDQDFVQVPLDLARV